MRILRFLDEEGRVLLGTDQSNDGTVEVLAGDLFGELIPSGERARVRRLLAPVAPPNIFGIGLNYREQARLSGAELPSNPMVFMKPTTAVTDPGRPIRLPGLCERPEVDYECELAVVIGRTAKDVPVESALQYVLGYTAANDVSARQWQKTSGARGKSFDCFCPIGPALVTADEIPDPQILKLRTSLNGKLMQESNTADMVFGVAELISFLSRDTTLLPGTLILTGTPPGTGFSQDPPVFLASGDEVAVEVDKIGLLANPVTDEDVSVEVAA